jgi:hypothetical protein
MLYEVSVTWIWDNVKTTFSWSLDYWFIYQTLLILDLYFTVVFIFGNFIWHYTLK